MKKVNTLYGGWYYLFGNWFDIQVQWKILSQNSKEKRGYTVTVNGYAVKGTFGDIDKAYEAGIEIAQKRLERALLDLRRNKKEFIKNLKSGKY